MLLPPLIYDGSCFSNKISRWYALLKRQRETVSPELQTIMALPTAPWRFEREDIGILPTAFPVDKNPTFSYTTTKVNGDVLAGDAWVITQTSPFTTLPAASLDEVSSSSLGTHIMTSSQTLTQADVLESSTACQNAIGRSSTTSLPSVMAEAFTSGGSS